MFCTTCGKELNDEAILCPSCGAPTKNFLIQSQPEQENQDNGMAIAGFICSFFIPLLGWIFGGIGLARSQRRNGKEKGFSISALAISTVTFLVNFFWIISLL